jgi:hypothetical protein
MLGVKEVNPHVKCSECNSEQLEAIVQYGSYVLRCARCGTAIVATSFLAMREMEAEFFAYSDPGHGKHPLPEALVAQGSLKSIYGLISKIASNGAAVLLLAAQPTVQRDGP